MLNSFAYLRVSDPSQIDGDGFPRQEKACQDYAKTHDMKILQIFREEGVSGTKEHRPQLALMLVSMEQNHHGVKTVIIEKLDRLARDILVQEAIIKDFQNHGFTLISTKEGDDLCDNDPSRKAMRQMAGVFAEYEKSMMVYRLWAGKERKRAKGEKADGRKGYNDSEEGRDLILYVKSLSRKPKGRKRLTYQQIADTLNEEEKRTLDGKLWSLHRVRDIILNR